ncbi:MAG: plasmid maintenance system killer protein [Lachnospiraceae bacterium]|nr:plasmid maintenance system killer protein [Lachnospiraceae bacterium]
MRPEYSTYKNKKIEKVCTNAKTAERMYGHEMAGKIDQRIGEIGAADTVEMMIQFRIGRCHPLTQNRKGQYAVDLVHPYRLVFEKKGNEIQIANILEIVDYHK